MCLFHKWVILKIYNFRYHDETEVFYRCEKCGKTKIKYIEGIWTLEELKGK